MTEYGEYKLHIIQGYIASLFLVEYPRGMLLLDAGSACDVERIARYCEEVIGRPVTDIKLAVTSHMHPDHGGGAHQLRRKYGIPLAGHVTLDDWYAGATGWIQHKMDIYMTHVMARHQHRPYEKMYYPRRVGPDYLLNDGDPLPGFEDWQAVWTPGHTWSDLALWHPATKMLYVVDMLNELRGKYYLPLPVLFHDEMAQSFEKMAALDARHVLLAHDCDRPFEVRPEEFLAMREQLDKPVNRVMRYVYRNYWMSPVWRQYRRRCKAEGRELIPAGFFRMK